MAGPIIAYSPQLMDKIIALSPELIIMIWGLLTPLLDAFTEKREKLITYWTYFGLSAALIATLLLLQEKAKIWGGILVVDSFSQFFKLVFLIVGILAVGTAVSTKEVEDIGVYSSLVFYAVLGMMLVASSGELITLFVSLELTTLSLFALVGFIKKDPFSSEAAMKYFIIGAFSAAIILFGMSIIYGIAGSTYLDVISHSLAVLIAGGHNFYVYALALGVMMLIAGFGFEIAAVPFHLWVPDTYQGAPTSITIILATGAEAMGFAAVFRIFAGSLTSLGDIWSMTFAMLAILTMTWGNVAALAQTNVKRMLAYSSIGHAGYIMIALAVITPLGFAGGMLHILAYVFMTGGAFAVVAFFANNYKAHTYEDYSGLRDVAPVTSLAMAVFLLSLAGVPPLAGFLSKVVLFAAAVDGGMAMLAVFGIINSAISLYYYSHVLKHLYFRDTKKRIKKKPENRMFLFLMVGTVLLTLIIFLDAGRYIDLTLNAANALFCKSLTCL